MKEGQLISSYFVLLLEAVAVRGFHQVDVLQEVSDSDGGVQLSRLVRRFSSLAVIPRNIEETTVLRYRSAVVLVCARGGSGGTDWSVELRSSTKN